MDSLYPKNASLRSLHLSLSWQWEFIVALLDPIVGDVWFVSRYGYIIQRFAKVPALHETGRGLHAGAILLA